MWSQSRYMEADLFINNILLLKGILSEGLNWSKGWWLINYAGYQQQLPTYRQVLNQSKLVPR